MAPYKNEEMLACVCGSGYAATAELHCLVIILWFKAL